MAKRMLIDAAHKDEQRVVVLDNDTLLEADFYSAAKAQIKGNIYLARVTRVEPSLQAAFVDFGNGKHGFLPFSEIHPDYFQIPVADREALLEEVQSALNKRQPTDTDEGEADAPPQDAPKDTLPSEESSFEQEQPKAKRGRKKAVKAGDAGDDHAPTEEETPKPKRSRKKTPPVADAENTADTIDTKESAKEQQEPPAKKPRGRPRKKTVAAAIEAEVVFADGQEGSPPSEATTGTQQRNRGRRRNNVRSNGGDRKPSPRPQRRQDEDTDDLSDADFEARTMTRAILSKKYKIQEVIKRNQVILVQAAKEERGDKGAALTTYLSLPGRYCVLMPNTHRSGGISRRIADGADRKRLKSVLDELDLAPSMSLIVRTAGAQRTKQEIKRDFAYLTRTWDEIRETTLNSFAPTLVYEEASLIKRAIRDVYESDTQEVLVAGDAAHRTAKAFMKTLTPSHATRVKAYKEPMPLFQAYGVEGMLESLNRPTVRLPSGGYLVLNQTEALVAVDVNSGKATRERNIEETALRTNIEAAQETARQLRLRDLAGLVVIDFIDMEENRNIGAVERTLKEALKPDRARIQVGRISQFGLMELSRQRLRPSVAEATMAICPICEGTGYTKSNSGTARAIARQIEEALAKGDIDAVRVFAGSDLALTLSNEQRAEISRLETTFSVSITIAIDHDLGPTLYRSVVDRHGRHETLNNNGAEPKSGGRNRNRGSKPKRDEQPSEQRANTAPAMEGEDEGDRRRRRRGKRGGRRRGKHDDEASMNTENGSSDAPSSDQTPGGSADLDISAPEDTPQREIEAPVQTSVSEQGEAPKPKRTRKRGSTKAAKESEVSADQGENTLKPDSEAKSTKTKSTEPHEEGTPAEAQAAPPADTPPSSEPKRQGWWSRVRGS